MFDFLKRGGNNNANNKEDIVVLKKTKKGMCGGTDATLDRKAPKIIESRDIISFEATSALNTYGMSEKDGEDVPGYVSAFAVPCGGGTFMLLSVSGGFRRRDTKKLSVALIKENVLPALASLINECDLAKNNGFHSETHGLPENFGGSVRVLYASGEKISFSNNQSPVLKYETGVMIKEFFEKAISGEKVSLPDVDALKEIRFFEKRSGGSYTNAVLSLKEDGGGTVIKESKYDGPEVYRSEKEVSSESVVKIKETISRTLLFGWAELPESGFMFGAEKHLHFLFSDGKEIRVSGSSKVPPQIADGFFKVEIEITR